MIKGKELWNELKQDICKIILNSEHRLIFLIGDNSTGKSDIGRTLKDEIFVLDNYTGTYDNIPKDKKVLVITHNVNLLLQANQNTKVIITQPNNLYRVTTCDVSNYSEIIEMMYNFNPLSDLLNNAIAGAWSELNEMFLQEYLNLNKLSSADKLVVKTIEEFKSQIA